MTEQNTQQNYEINNYELQFIPYGNNFAFYNIYTVKKWLKDHNLYNKELRYLSNQLYNSNGIYANVIDYMTALPTLDRVIFSRNRSHQNYVENRKKFIDALDKIKEKEIVRDILFKFGVDGTSFYYFDTQTPKAIPKYLSNQTIEEITEINNKFNCAVIPLPTDYCRIIGRKNSSYLVAFDCSYFDQFTGNGRSKKLRRYPKEIRDGYKEYRKDLNKQWIVLDNNKTMTFKGRAKLEDRWGRPIGLAAFIDMLYDEYFVDTKRSVLDEVNTSIFYQTFPEGKEKGTSSLTQKQQKEQHENIKDALFSKGIRRGINFFSVAAGTKIDKLKTDIDILKVKSEDDLIKRISTNLGFAGSMLNGESGNIASQRSNLQLIAAEIFSWLEQIQNELNKVINANIIKDNQVYMEVYYLPITHTNRKEQVDFWKELYTHGSGSLTAWIAATGVNPDAYLALMDEEVELKFDEKYKPHPISFTQSNNDKQKPINNDSDNPNTIKNKMTGANPIE